MWILKPLLLILKSSRLSGHNNTKLEKIKKGDRIMLQTSDKIMLLLHEIMRDVKEGLRGIGKEVSERILRVYNSKIKNGLLIGDWFLRESLS